MVRLKERSKRWNGIFIKEMLALWISCFEFDGQAKDTSKSLSTKTFLYVSQNFSVGLTFVELINSRLLKWPLFFLSISFALFKLSLGFGLVIDSALAGRSWFFEEEVLYELLIVYISVLRCICIVNCIDVLNSDRCTCVSTTTPHLAMALKKSAFER